MKNRFHLLITFLFFTCTLFLHAQDNGATYEVKGKISDDATGEPLIGANVSYEAGKGVQTDLDGNFALKLPNGKYDIKISYIGYTTIVKKVTVAGQDVSIEPVRLLNANTLDEVEIAADVARTRETPVAFSDIDSKQISEELGANDITALLNTTPGAYASQQGGGAGDSRVNIRGFDQRNIAVLVDGVPVNDMENGQVYWSNWAGLAEVTKKMQVQRGLGASRLAVPSVGGVMNIITNSIDQKQLFTVKENLGTNNYQRYSVAYNSGIIKNKFGITLAASYTEGDGYIDQTWQRAYAYFGKVSYKINDRNLLILSYSGAPQSHAQRSYAINMAYHNRDYAIKQGINVDSIYALPYAQNPYTTTKIGARGITYSPDWGYVNGSPFSAKINFFNKPLANLSYFLTINPRLSFSNVLYYSSGKGGGTTLSSFPQYDKGGTGQLNLQGYYDVNTTAPVSTVVPGQRQSAYYQYASMNNHNWVGTLSTMKWRMNSQLEVMGGLDARYYIGTHYQTPYNMLGGDFVVANSDANANPNDKLAAMKYIGDKMNYYYQSKITWLGLFAQAEYKTKKLTAFVTLTGSQSGYQIVNYFTRHDIVFDKNDVMRNVVGYGDTLYDDGKTRAVKPSGFPATKNADGTVTFKDGLTKQNVTMQSNYKTYNNNSPEARANTSAVKLYIGYTLKGGVNYKLDRNHNIYANVGHMNLAPRFTNVYDRSGSAIDDPKNQFIYSGEIGYNLRYTQVALTLNAYMTDWRNRPLDFAATSSLVDPLTNAPVYYNINGVDAIMKGVEFDLTYKPFKGLEARGFGSFADWRWNSGGTNDVYTETGTLLESIKFDATGVHVGNAPQLQLGASVRYELTKGFYIKPQFTYFDKMYAQFDPTKLILDEAAGKDYRRMDSWKMPAYGLIDLYMGYRIYSDRVRVEITGSMNNVLNTVYMTDANFSTSGTASLGGTTPDKYSAMYSYGWIGLGRRINLGVKVTF